MIKVNYRKFAILSRQNFLINDFILRLCVLCTIKGTRGELISNDWNNAIEVCLSNVSLFPVYVCVVHKHRKKLTVHEFYTNDIFFTCISRIS